ncbi:MAG: hypothetical protein IJG33_16885 [Selenomonadaceae bacterium]|nr:hypothetical protein [Selenomonadaceae bacterium]
MVTPKKKGVTFKKNGVTFLVLLSATRVIFWRRDAVFTVLKVTLQLLFSLMYLSEFGWECGGREEKKPQTKLEPKNYGGCGRW